MKEFTHAKMAAVTVDGLLGISLRSQQLFTPMDTLKQTKGQLVEPLDTRGT